MLLLDEGKELHMMVTNSLKQDMNHKVPVSLRDCSRLPGTGTVHSRRHC